MLDNSYLSLLLQLSCYVLYGFSIFICDDIFQVLMVCLSLGTSRLHSHIGAVTVILQIDIVCLMPSSVYSVEVGCLSLRKTKLVLWMM